MANDEIVSLDSGLAERYLENKRHYNGVSHALKIAKSLQLDHAIQELTEERRKANVDRLRMEDQILKQMPKSANMVHILNDWYGIKFLDSKNKTAFKDDILHSTDLHLIFRNPKKEANLRHTDLDAMLPAVIDYQALELYKHEIRSASNSILEGYGITPDAEPVDEGTNESFMSDVMPSTHAGERWVERVLRVSSNKPRVQEYYRANRSDVDQQIVEAYNKAEHFWSGTGGEEYLFDNANVMYVLGGNTIITLYEEDFGFTKEINRIITLKQRDVLQQARDSLNEVEEGYNASVESIDEDVLNLDNEIQELMSQIDLLNAQKSALLANKDVKSRQLRVLRDKYIKEHDKLFKKWEV